MVSKELKKLSRRDLIDIIYQMKKNEQKMQEEIASMKTALEDKRMRLSDAGSIAEAAVSITDVFSTAQSTADLYLQEISALKEETEQVCRQKIDIANRHVTRILTEGKKDYQILLDRYQKDYEKWQQLCAEIEALKKAGKWD